MGKRALLLVNRHARQAEQFVQAVSLTLASHGLEVIEESTRHARAISETIRRYRDRVDLVIVGGGDGTLNAASDGLVDTQLPLGVLPLGTANDLARTLNLPGDPYEACRVIAAGHTR